MSHRPIVLTAVIWVGLNSNRIPVLHPFWPHFIHYNDVGSDIAVSDIFDLQSLRAALDDMPMVDLFELKATKGIEPRWRRILYDGENRQMRADGTEYIKGDWIEPFVGQDEELSCWSFWQNLGAETEYSADRFNASECVHSHGSCSITIDPLATARLSQREVVVPLQYCADE